MDKKELEQLLNEAIEAYRALENAEKGAKKWLEARPEPESEGAYESLDDFLQFIRERQSYGGESRKVAEDVSRAISALEEVTNRFAEQLPALVWCKIGDYGVGLSYDAGYRVAIAVEPWSDEMPELDSPH